MLEKTTKTTVDEAGEAAKESSDDASGARQPQTGEPARPVEIGGRKGPDPTRYGDWEKNGRCIDF